MAVELLGVTHRTAPVELRERLALDTDARVALARELARSFGEAVVIGTCNRTEVYWTGRPGPGREEVLTALSELAGVDAPVLAAHVLHRCGAAAVRHACRVAAGLESQILGEPQILGQVRDAADEARRAGTLGPVLDRLFTVAVVAGKRARTETPISRGAGSVGQAAAQLARSAFGDLSQARVLVIGAGEMARTAAVALSSFAPAWLGIANRTAERATALASAVGADVVPWEALDRTLATVDVAVVATGAQEHLLTRERLARIADARHGCLLVLIDIAVPRNVDPAAASLPGIVVYDIDALTEVRAEGKRLREQAVPHVEAIVEEHVRAFLEWERARTVAPLIRQLREQVEAIRQEETDRALRRLGHLSERDRQVVLALSHGIANKLLHRPITRLRESGVEAPQARALADLFGLELD